MTLQEFYELHPHKQAEYDANDRAAYRRDPRKALVRQAKYRAKKFGLAFNITADDVPPMTELCPLLGIPLVVADGASCVTPNSPTLDRIDNRLGYVVGNVLIISYLANSSKRELDSAQLMRLAINLRRYEKRCFPWEI